MALYHRDVFIPRGIRKQFEKLCETYAGIHILVYSRHAEQAAKNDRYGEIPLTPQMTFDKMELVEVEHDGNKIIKVLLREVGQEKNRVMALIPVARGQWLVKTVWFNLSNDSHKTLNRAAYVQRK